MAQVVKLNPDEVKELRKINPALISYNVEMTEVTGGTFWKASQNRPEVLKWHREHVRSLLFDRLTFMVKSARFIFNENPMRE